MNKNSVAGNNSGESLKRALFDNKVIIMLVVLCFACILIADTNVSYIASEVFTRFGRNTCLVLALIIPCLAGLGMNFGIVIGATAAQIAIFWVVHWGFTGIFGFLLCVVLCTPLALVFGYLLGKLYNKTKGAEMITGLVLGFFADGLYRLFVLYIIGGVIPYDDPNLLDRGFGLRNAFDLTGNIKYALDDISFLTVLALVSILMILSTLAVSLHDKKKGNPMDSKKIGIRLVTGAAVLVFSFVARMIPITNQLFGGTRLIFTDAALFGGLGLILYGIMGFLIRRSKGEKGPGKAIGTAVLGGLLMAGTVIAPVREIYQSIQLPAAAYAVICIFCMFNNWITNTRLGQNMRTVGQSRSVATSAGINVDKTRIIATCISTVLAAWGQMIFLQNLGTFNTVQQQSNVGLYAVAAILVGGATVQKANNKQAVIGVFLFHTLFVVAPLAATKVVGDSAISEYIRMFISYGIIAVSLAMHAWKSAGGNKNKGADAQTAAAVAVTSGASDLPDSSS
ncbi:MAG: ABC transporter permease [Lachnospiraceae bacterium]|nr:ABC transporter permease [Lachnospiraceae bacterium]